VTEQGTHFMSFMNAFLGFMIVVPAFTIGVTRART
jgi:hypothetical protein